MVWGACITLGFMVLLVGIAWWTMIRMPGASYRGKLPASDDALTQLQNELREDVTKIASEIGERNAKNRPEQLAQTAAFIESRFVAMGYSVQSQPYDASTSEGRNLEASIPGTRHPEQIVIVGAHYDSAHGTPGADDNASGVAGMLALARHFSKCRVGCSLRFVAFVNEEPPYFQKKKGSWVYAKRCRERGENVVAMLSLEMLGYYDDKPGSQHYPLPFSMIYPTTGDFIGLIGNTASRDLVRRSLATFRRHERFPSEGAAVPEAIRGVSFSDHASFWRAGYPALMVTDTAMFRNPHYHESDDTVDKIDFDQMARVVRGLEQVVAELAGAE